MVEEAQSRSKQAFAEYTEKVLKPQIEEEEKHADKIAKLVVEFTTNEDGQELANVQTS